MPGETHVYFTAFSSGRKGLVNNNNNNNNNNNITNFVKMSFGAELVSET